jgi:zinc protease
VRQKEGLSYGIGSSISIPSQGTDARFLINAITNPANIDRVEAAVFEELKKFIEEGPSEQELAEAKTAWLESRKLSYSGDSAIAGQLAAGLYLGRSFKREAEERARIESLTVESVKTAFQRHIPLERLVVIRAGDFPK